MTLIDEILSFSIDYVNLKKERTIDRKRKIRIAYKKLFGKEMQGSCPTCYIEAMLEIVKSFKKLNIEEMATPKGYELKRGYLASFDFGAAFNGIKSFTNDQLTDELAEEYLKRYPERIIYFARTPGPIVPNVPPQITIIPPAKTIIIPPIIIPPKKEENIVDTILETAGIKVENPETVIEVKSVPVIPKKKGGKKPNAKK